jgi:hypothetical protein
VSILTLVLLANVPMFDFECLPLKKLPKKL